MCHTVHGALAWPTFWLGRQMRNVVSKSCEDRLDFKIKKKDGTGD